MPFVSIEVVEGLAQQQRRALLSDVPALIAEIMESPVARLRVRVAEGRTDLWSVGGVPASDLAGPDGLPPSEQAPFVTFDILEGRPRAQQAELISRVSALVAHIVGCPVDRVRMRLGEVPPHLWGIGGVSAAEKRAGEVASRGAADG